MPPKDAAPTGPDVNLRKDLGIAEIADKATQDQVGGYVEKEIPADKREALNTLKKDEAALTELRKKMSDLNKKTDAQATDYVDAIISALQEEECTTAIEKNYIPAFLEAVGTKGVESLGNKDSGHSIDWEVKADGTSPVLNYCMDHLRAVAKTVPGNIKPGLRDEYMRAYTDAYAQAIDNFDWLGEKFDVEEQLKPENKLKEDNPSLVSFEAWLAAPPRNKKLDDASVTVSASELDAAAIMDVQGRLKTARATIAGLDDDAKATLNTKVEAISAIPMTKAKEAQTQMALLEKEIQGAQAKAEAAKKAAETSAVTPPPVDQPPTTPTEDQGILDTIIASSKEAKDYIVGMFKNLPNGIGTMVVELLGFMGLSKVTIASIKSEMAQNGKEGAVIEKVKSFFKKKLKMADEQLTEPLFNSLKDMQLSQFLSTQPAGFPKDKYEQMVVLLTKGGAKAAAVGTKVTDFINQHADDLEKIDSVK